MTESDYQIQYYTGNNNPGGDSVTLFTLMSHAITETQREDARRTLGIDRFATVPSEHWGAIPADAISVRPYTAGIKNWLDAHAVAGDVLLVQGDFGATVDMITYAKRRKIIPVYATTRRVVEERTEGESVVTIRRFEHVRFREYECDV